MDNPQELKKAILAALAEKGDYSTVLSHLDDDEKNPFGEDAGQMRDLIMQSLVEKGDYKSVLSYLTKGEKKTKEQKALNDVIKPFTDIAQLVVGNTKGDFMKDLVADMDGKLSARGEELLKTLTDNISAFQLETKAVLDEATQENIATLAKTVEEMKASLLEMAVRVVADKAEEITPIIAGKAKLTQAEIDDIIYQTALSVESQVANILGDYVQEQGITVDQIIGFKESVEKLIPQVDFSAIEVDWSQIKNAPDISQGGTSAYLVQRLIDKALEGFVGGSGIQSIVAGTGISVDNTDPANPIISATGGGGGGAVDSVNGQTGVVVLDADDIDDTSTTHKFTTASDISKLAGIQAGAEVNVNADWNAVSGDAQILNKPTLAVVATSNDYNDLSNRPNLSNFVDLTSVQTLTNKSFNDSTFFLQDESDTTKKLQFQLSSITSGATRTLTVPNNNIILLGRSEVATVTNKSIDLGSNTITGTKAQYNTSVTDGDFMFVGDAPTAHTHTLANITDVTITAANLNTLDDGADTTLHFHASDRNRDNHTGTQLASTISDFASTVIATLLTGFTAAGTRTAIVATDSILVAFGKVQKYFNDLATIAFSGALSDATGTINDTQHGTRGGGTLHANATTSVAGFMSSADKTKLDGVATGANNYVHPNHTGDVTSTGDGATVIAPVAITNKTTVTPVSGDFVLISDTSDSGNLKKVDASNFLGGGGGGITEAQARAIARRYSLALG